MTDEAKPARAWDSASYDRNFAFVWQYGESLIELLAPQPGERILDVGSGTGHLTARIAESGAEAVGLDADADMIARARENYPACEFVQANAVSFAFEEPFDAVFSNATLHWVKPPEAAARCIATVLKPGGRFVAELGGRGNIEGIKSAIIAARTDAGLAMRPEMIPWYYPNVPEYVALLDSVGLETTFAHLFPRLTPLDGGESGLRGWLTMFATALTSDLSDQQREALIQDIERRLRPTLFREGRWWADYLRLRIVAVKP
ncbi:MAG TPA: methyltransferase domain-containing protein [Dehalococcoidia bacterium]|nr:methyltransferase domain-containing protein [Dehalococcoidia bacterium]